MGFFSRLFGKKDNKIELTKEELVEAGACPNCWGTQDYGGQYIEYRKDQTKSNINNDKQNQKAFVAEFVETHVSGIKLTRKEDRLQSPKCKAVV